MAYLTPKQGSQIVKLILAGMLSFLLLLTYVYFQGRSSRAALAESERNARIELVNAEATARSRLIVSQRAGCERSKLDRQDNADFQRAHAAYILKVTGAASVKEDVKRAARTAEITFKRTSKSLSQRAKIDCAKVFPKQ